MRATTAKEVGRKDKMKCMLVIQINAVTKWFKIKVINQLEELMGTQYLKHIQIIDTSADIHPSERAAMLQGEPIADIVIYMGLLR